MFLNLIKFIHVLLALSLLSITIYCSVSLQPATQRTHVNKILLFLCFFAMLTGTLLVYPSQFTFHTPWIIAAYVLLIGYSVGIILLLWYKKTWRWVYLLLLIILIAIVHDAVMKTTLIHNSG